MNLTLIGHEDRYAVEQLQMALFPENPEGSAISSLSRGKIWLTATAKITLNGKTVSAVRRLKADEETVRLRRRILQQSYYLAAIQLLDRKPAWGALAGVLCHSGAKAAGGGLLRVYGQGRISHGQG